MQVGERQDYGMGDLVLNRFAVTGYPQDIYEPISDNVRCFLSGTVLKKLLRKGLSHLFYVTAFLI